MIKVSVKGSNNFQKDLELASDRFRVSIDGLLEDLAFEGAKDARRRARSGMLTGRSMDSIRASGPRIIAGAGVPWYGFADFGGRVGKGRRISRHYIRTGRWLFPAVRDLDVKDRAQALVEKTTKGF